MLEDGQQRSDVARLQVLEKERGDELTRHVSDAPGPQDLLLQLHESTALGHAAPKAAGRVEHVEVDQIGEFHTVQHGPSLQEGPIEGFSVERHDSGRALELADQLVHEGGFLVIVAHEELADTKLVAPYASDSDEEGVRAGPSFKARRLRVDKHRLVYGEGPGAGVRVQEALPAGARRVLRRSQRHLAPGAGEGISRLDRHDGAKRG